LRAGKRLAVGGRRNSCSVGDGGDRAKTLSRLSVCHDLPVGGVNTRVVGILGITGFEDFVFGVVRGIERATNTIKNVFAEVSGVRPRGVTSLQTEGISSHEAMKLSE